MTDRGDSRGLEDLCRDLHPRLFRSLALYCGSEAVAEELTQETLIRLWVRGEGLRSLRSPEAWAYKVAFNLAHLWGRRNGAEQRAQERVAQQPTSLATDPADAVADQDTVLRAIAALPPRQRAALVLRHLDDLSVETTAEILGCAAGTVKALTSQAIASLHRQLPDLSTEETEAPHA